MKFYSALLTGKVPEKIEDYLKHLKITIIEDHLPMGTSISLIRYLLVSKRDWNLVMKERKIIK